MSNIYLYWWNFFILFILLLFFYLRRKKQRSNASTEQSDRVHTNVQGWEDSTLICSEKPRCTFPYPGVNSGGLGYFCTMTQICVSHLTCNLWPYLWNFLFLLISSLLNLKVQLLLRFGGGVVLLILGR